jgi:osmotically inducible protein OsmC
MSKDLYTAAVHVVDGREGRAVADDGLLDVALAMPAALGGPGKATNPEQLFAAGFAGCFSTSIKYTAKAMKLDAGLVEVDGKATLRLNEDGSYGLKVHLAAKVPGLSGELRDKVVAEAKRVCAYTNATRGNVPFELTLL